MKKKTILIIGTGGTIAGEGVLGKSLGYTAGQILIKDLVATIPGIEELANLEAYNLFNIDSCNMTREKLLVLSKFINEAAKDDKYDGFVISHGTDTLEETSYFINLTLKTEKPVIFTGAMRPATAISADGALNLYHAIALARSDSAKCKGVLVVFGNGIFSARNLHKTDTVQTTAFREKTPNCAGYMHDDEIHLFRTPKKNIMNDAFDVSDLEKLPKTEVLMFYNNADVGLLEYACAHSDGVVIAGAGDGGVSDEWLVKIREFIKLGYPIVRSTRVTNGIVFFNNEIGISEGLTANNLTPQHSIILLSLALTKTKKLETIQCIFDEY